MGPALLGVGQGFARSAPDDVEAAGANDLREAELRGEGEVEPRERKW